MEKNAFRYLEYSSVLNFQPGEGESAYPMPMRYDLLKLIELSGINDLDTFYLKFYKDEEEAGQANLYITDTDLATLDSAIPGHVSRTIRRWYPAFMQFRVMECGFFTMVGDGLVLKKPEYFQSLMPLLLDRLDAISAAQAVDIQVIRDIPPDKYRQYNDILGARGFFPTLGFANTYLPLIWENMDAYLQALKGKYRKRFNKTIKNLEEFEIEWEFTNDYGSLCPELFDLWHNVYKKSPYYQREFLTEKFFRTAAQHLADSSEVLLFRQKNRLIAFSLNFFDANTYYGLDWGIDYTFPGYEKAKLYEANTLINLKRAIDLGKKQFELGITNYALKQQLGMLIQPFVYFVKHTKNAVYSRPLAQMLTANISQPAVDRDSVFTEPLFVQEDFPGMGQRIREEQTSTTSDDIFERTAAYYKPESVRLAGIYGFYTEFRSAQTSSIRMENQQDVVLLGTNSYLGLADHPDVLEATRHALHQYGSGSSGSPLQNGTFTIHKLLETGLADFLNREAVVLCSTGYQTNLAGISALCRAGDVVAMDERNHRSLFDAVKLSGAAYYVYKHLDMEHLEKILKLNATIPKMIVTDSVFSLEGTIPDLKTMCGLAKKYRARMFVDESHAIGVFGENGRGICEMLGIEKEVDLIMSTFSKSFASIGGFIAGGFKVIDYIKHNAGGHMFSCSIPPASAATALAVLKIIREQPERRRDILEKARYMATELRKMGYRTGYHGTQIVSITLGNMALTLAAGKRLLEAGVYVNTFGPPAVPECSAGLRTSYIATHTQEDLDRALEVFRLHSGDFN